MMIPNELVIITNFQTITVKLTYLFDISRTKNSKIK